MYVQQENVYIDSTVCYLCASFGGKPTWLWSRRFKKRPRKNIFGLCLTFWPSDFWPKGGSEFLNLLDPWPHVSSISMLNFWVKTGILGIFVNFLQRTVSVTSSNGATTFQISQGMKSFFPWPCTIEPSSVQI